MEWSNEEEQMGIEELVDLLSRLGYGEDIDVETEVTIRAQLSVNGMGGRDPVYATIFFKSEESEEILFSASIKKTRNTWEGSTMSFEDLPLMVSDLEILPGVEQHESWTITGHSY
jgi:hypothetical protein